MRRDFIANAAHELRTPLTNLQGYLEALRDGVIVADRATYESLHEEADRLVRLSRSLDALAEGDAGASPLGSRRPRPGCRGPLGARSCGARHRAGRSSPGDRRCPAGPARPLRPRRTCPGPREPPLNAVRYTPAGGTITVRVERRPGDYLISVANTGERIPADDLDRVFERFYRVDKSRDRARGGAGIGLAIVKQLVEASGGRVGANRTTDSRASGSAFRPEERAAVQSLWPRIGRGPSHRCEQWILNRRDIGDTDGPEFREVSAPLHRSV